MTINYLRLITTFRVTLKNMTPKLLLKTFPHYNSINCFEICFRYMQNVFCLYFANIEDTELTYAFMAVSSIQIIAVMSIVYFGFVRSDHLFKRKNFLLRDFLLLYEG